MYIKTIIFIILILILKIITPAYSSVIKVKVIEFRDLYYLSKYEIINKVDVKVNNNDNEIIIDIDSLKKELNENPIVKSFRIIENDRRLIVTIVENEPKFLLALKMGQELMPFEIDKEFKILSTSRIHALNKPLVIVSEGDIINDQLSNRIKNTLILLEDLSKGKLMGLLKEIREIDLTNTSKAKIIFNKRRTVFKLNPGKRDFFKLNYALGYFDKVRYYPGIFEITGNSGIIIRKR